MVKEENIIQIDFSEEMKNSYRDYAMSVIIARALPDVRDGLKPVQRRILYAMEELGLNPDKPHRKSARIVGDTMGKYHPHGDSSIYDALVHMTEDYSLSIPLVDGHGNFGSIDGDSAAAMRYTEARLSAGAKALLDNLSMGLVPFVPNFDESEKEPTVLPAQLPNLLINGTTGIAVGMATNMPPHNPGEVIDGVIAYLDQPLITVSKLMRYIKGPDFPTGGIITNPAVLEQIYETGEGKLKVRAKAELEKGENGRQNIVITEIPYPSAGNKTKLVENISTLMRDKVFDEIYDVRDESSKEGIRIVIEVKKDRNPQNLLNGLYKKTGLEDTYGVNMLAVKQQQPIVFNLKTLIAEFVAFQEELYTKEYQFKLDKAKNRQEIVKGLIKATDVIDLIIEILRGSQSVKQAKACLIEGKTDDIKFKTEKSKKQAAKLDFTEKQADAILAMPLGRLIGLEILKLHEEDAKLAKEIAECEEILGNQQSLHQVIKTRLRAFKKQFGRERRTLLLESELTEYKEEVRIEELVVMVDRFGYVKCLDTASYGRMAQESKEEFVHTVFLKSDDKLICFTKEGNAYQIRMSAIPRCRARDKGVLIQTLCKLGREEVVYYTGFEQLFESQLMFVTEGGFVKLVSGIEFETVRSVIASTKLEEEDRVCAVFPVSAAQYNSGTTKVILLTEKGLSLGFLVDEVGELKRASRGVKGIALEPGDKVCFAACVDTQEESLTVEGKTINPKKIRLRKRGAKGQKATIEC